jgi:hypothetical protein
MQRKGGSGNNERRAGEISKVVAIAIIRIKGSEWQP